MRNSSVEISSIPFGTDMQPNVWAFSMPLFRTEPRHSVIQWKCSGALNLTVTLTWNPETTWNLNLNSSLQFSCICYWAKEILGLQEQRKMWLVITHCLGTSRHSGRLRCLFEFWLKPSQNTATVRTNKLQQPSTSPHPSVWYNIPPWLKSYLTMLPITLHTTKQDSIKIKTTPESNWGQAAHFLPIIFTLPSGFYWQGPDSGMTQQSESGFFDASYWCTKGSSCFLPLKTQSAVTFAQLEWLQGCNGLVIITIIKVVAEFL